MHVPSSAATGQRTAANHGTAERLDRALATLGVDHDVKEYPDAGHAFLNDHEGAGDRTPAIFVVMGKFGGPSGYHESSAMDARRADRVFLRSTPDTVRLIFRAVVFERVASRQCPFQAVGWRQWSACSCRDCTTRKHCHARLGTYGPRTSLRHEHD